VTTPTVHRLSVPVNATDHISGVPDAPLLLLEYGDYECPYCGAAYGIVKQVQDDFGERLAFVFRNFPLTSVHPHALAAAEAKIKADLASGARSGVNGTPTFFINGLRHDGGWDEASLVAALRAAER
jgi:protein-disulfide isomerase